MAASPQFCAVTIGAEYFLLSLKDGTRLLEILSQAVPLAPTYNRDKPRWRAIEADARRFELAIVRSDDIDVSDVPLQPRWRAGSRLARPGGR